MATDERKVQLGIEVDADGAQAGFDQVKAGAKDMASSVAQAGQVAGKGVDSIGNGGDGAAQKMDRATKSIIGSIQRTTAAMEAGSKGSAQYYEYLAKQRGIDPTVLKPYLDQLDAVSKKHSQAGISAAQMQAALRGVPAQFTDIVTALASGQQPITVLLQQGGQLKDMFGGVGNAAKAIGGYVSGMINPITVGAATIGLLAYAAHAGAQESANLEKAIILSGNAAATTGNQLSDMAANVSASVGGTRAAAAEVLQLAVSGGQVAAANLGKVTEAATAMERATGKAITETVSQFNDLGRAPVEASAKLNEQYNYLTASIYKQIKALEDQGRKEDAAALAQQTYADALKTRASAIEENLGDLERGWRSITDAAKGAWDAMLGAGRKQTYTAAIKEIQQDLARGTTDAYGGDDGAKASIARLQALVEEEKKRSQAKDESNAKEKAQIQWLQQGEKYLTEQQRLEKEIARIRQEGKIAGLPQGDIDQRVKLARQDYDKAVAEANANNLISSAKGYAARYGEYYKQELDNFRLSTEDYLSAMAALERQALETERAAIARQQPTDAAGRIQKSGRLAELDAQIADVSTKQQRALEDAATKSQEVLSKMAVAAGKTLDPLEQAGRDFVDRWGKDMQRAAIDGNDAIIASGAAVWKSMSDEAQFKAAKDRFDALFADMELQIEQVKQAANADGGLLSGLFAAGKADDIRARLMPAVQAAHAEMEQYAGTSLVNQKSVTESQRNLTKIVDEGNQTWRKFTDDIERSLTDSLMRGFESGKSLGQSFVDSIQNTLKTAVLKVAVQAVVDPVMGVVRNVVGSAGSSIGIGGTGGIGSGLSLVSNGASIYNAFTGTSGLYGSIATSGVGQWLGLSSAADFVGPSAMFAEDAAIASTASGEIGLSALGSSIGAALPWVAGALAVGSMLGMFGGGGEDPHNNADSIGVGYRLSKYGVTGAYSSDFYGGGSDVPVYWVEGQTSGAGRWGDRYNMSGDQIAALNSQVAALYFSAENLAKQFGVSREAIDSVSLTITRTASAQEGIGAAMQKTVDALSDALARTLVPEIDSLKVGSETLAQALERVAGNVQLVDSWSNRLGMTIDGYSAKNSLVMDFGSSDAMNSSLTSYYQAYFSQQERKSATQNELTSTFAALGLGSVPGSRAEFRELVSAQDLATESGRKMYATLIALSGAFAEVTAAASDVVNLDKSGFSNRVEYLRATRTVGKQDAVTVSDPALVEQINTLRKDFNAGQVAIAQFAARTAKVLERWEGGGIPESRSVQA